jgi:hypothetical protein
MPIAFHAFQKDVVWNPIKLGDLAHPITPDTCENESGRSEFEVGVSHIVRPCLIKEIKGWEDKKKKFEIP